uniref:DNA 3'-5' helicase n=2 Tax=Barramundi adomavirus TaxID=2609870 RepID=A0A6F9F3J4_9VIRU|nr:TPA_asm: large T antigen [Barramundi adomavirus]
MDSSDDEEYRILIHKRKKKKRKERILAHLLALGITLPNINTDEEIVDLSLKHLKDHEDTKLQDLLSSFQQTLSDDWDPLKDLVNLPLPVELKSPAPPSQSDHSDDDLLPIADEESNFYDLDSSPMQCPFLDHCVEDRPGKRKKKRTESPSTSSQRLFFTPKRARRSQSGSTSDSPPPRSSDDDSGLISTEPNTADEDDMPTTQATPEKPVEPKMPQMFDDTYSKASNTHTCVSSFMLYYNICKIDTVLSVLPDIGHVNHFVIGKVRGDPDMVFHAIMFQSAHRLSRVVNVMKNYFTTRTHCISRVILSKHWPTVVHRMRKLCEIKNDGCTQPSPDESFDLTSGKVTEKQDVDVVLLNTWALENSFTDPLMILGFYDQMAIRPTECPKCAKASDSDKSNPKHHAFTHEKHHSNALMFTALKDKKRIAVNAANTVLGHNKVNFSVVSNQDFYSARLHQIANQISETPRNQQIFSAALALLYVLGWQADAFIFTIYKALVEKDFKNRYVVFKGPYNSGKSSLASVIKKIFLGVSLNINEQKDSLKFELGRAIARRMVVFDDIKGIPEQGHDSLKMGYGVDRLDDMRDYLDGHLEVGLERKHQDKVDQVFPPGVITMNEYVLPTSLLKRIRKVFHFHSRELVVRFLKKTKTSPQMLTEERVFVYAMCYASQRYLFKGRNTFRSPFWPLQHDSELVQSLLDEHHWPEAENMLEDMCGIYGPPQPITVLQNDQQHRSFAYFSLEHRVLSRPVELSQPPPEDIPDSLFE